MTRHVDATLSRMRDVMLGNDWEAGALAHQAHHEAWAQQRAQSGQPSAPLGRWYVTHILMPQLTSAMLHGQPTATPTTTAATAQQANTTQEVDMLRNQGPEDSEQRGRRRSRSQTLEEEMAAEHAQHNPAWEHA